MKKLIIITLLVVGFSWGRTDYVNTKASGTNILTNMLLTAGYLTNVSSGGGGGASEYKNLTLSGNSLVGVKQLAFRSVADFTISGVKIQVDTAPTGATFLVDINTNGVSIFTNQANRPVIAISALTNTAGIPTLPVPVSEWTIMTVDIDQIGSTVGGGDNLYITIERAFD